MVATPLEFVRAVPAGGLNDPRLKLVVKVTTVDGTTTPSASLTVALIVTEPDDGKVVVATPAPSVIATITVGVAVLVLPLGVVEQPVLNGRQVVEVEVDPPPPPPPQPAMAATTMTTKAKRIREIKPEASKLRI